VGISSSALDTKQIPFPETLHALIAARLDGLSGEQKAILQDASVVGRSFWSAALASIGAADEANVKQSLHELSAKELVRPARRSSMENQTEYSFWHALIREVAYNQIPRAARARKHRAMASWIEHVAEDGAQERAELVAHHYRQALELARASGDREEALSLEVGTRRFLILAGDRAATLDAAKSARYYREALELVPPGDPTRAQTLVKASEVSMCMGAFDASQGYLGEAVSEFRASGDRAHEGAALAKLSKSFRDSGDTERARQVLTESIGILEQERDNEELSYAYVQWAGDALFSGSPLDALHRSDRALRLADEAGDSENKARALGIRGLARCELADPAGIEDLRKALALTKDLDRPHWIANAFVALAYMTWLTDGPEAAEALYDEAIDVGDRRGVTGDAMWARAESVWPLFDLGKWDDVLRRTDDVVEWERVHGGSQLRAMALPYKAAVLLHRGDLEEATTLVEKVIPLARDIGDLQVLVPALAIGSEVHAARGDSNAALMLIDELGKKSDPTPNWRARFLPEVLRVLSGAGSLQLADQLVVGEDQVATNRDRLSIFTAGALLAAAGHHFDEAESTYAEAATRWKQFGAAPEHAQALLEGGRCAFRLGHLEAAERCLSQAKDLFARLGAVRGKDEAESTLLQLASANDARKVGPS
jgi:tetratricopeptide (TPR) repeat protein